MLAEVICHLLVRRRVDAAHAWRDAEREAYEAAKQRILTLAPATPDPVGARSRRSA
jgi:hypothetical protein